MKVLILAPHAFFKGIKGYEKNKSGLAYIIGDIATGLSEKHIDTYILTQSAFNNKNTYNGVNIIQKRWFNILTNIKLQYMADSYNIFRKLNSGLIFKARVIAYHLIGGYIEKVIKNLNPDIVHIHGLGFYTYPFIMACRNCNVPYLITLHGLIGLDDSVLATQLEKEYERQILVESEKELIPVSVISSGIKNRIIKNYGLSHADNINIILNGTVIDNHSYSCKLNVREKYNIPKSNKIVLCVGGIGDRKNQIQLVEAYHDYNKELIEQTTVLFIGYDSNDSKLSKRILELGYESNLIYCGFIEKEELFSYWLEADLNIVVSLDEGFGLSMIEGFTYGVPTVAFSDLDAVKDIYNEGAMMLVKERSNKSLALTINKALNYKWNKDFIKEYSKQFSIDKMTTNYINFYMEIIKDGYDHNC